MWRRFIKKRKHITHTQPSTSCAQARLGAKLFRGVVLNKDVKEHEDCAYLSFNVLKRINGNSVVTIIYDLYRRYLAWGFYVEILPSSLHYAEASHCLEKRGEAF